MLIACERSGVVRRAFRARGHDAYSCDLEPADDGSYWHIRGDAIAAAYRDRWDLLIAHPECTYLANSGAKHLYAGMNKANGPNPDRWFHMGEAAAFFLALWRAPIPMIALENPIMLGHPKRLSAIPEPTQIIQPWQFGHGETKATCLWLKNLPKLVPTLIVDGREQRVFRMAPGPDRKRARSQTFEGIAAAMASQWGACRTSRRKDHLADSRHGWLAVKNPVDGIGPGLVQQCRKNYEADLLARIEELMDAAAGTPEGDELRALADEWIAHEQETLPEWAAAIGDRSPSGPGRATGPVHESPGAGTAIAQTPAQSPLS